MAYTAPTNEPSALRAGDTWSWRREDLGDYPASSWTLKYYFRNSSAKFDATERHQVDSGRVEVLPNLAVDAVYDARSFAQKMVDYIETELVSRGSSGQLDLINATLEGRGMTRDKAGLISLRNVFKAEVAAELRAKSGVRHNRILAVG